jgi:uncharacterized protein
MITVLLLVCSNVFMTFAWYRHLKSQAGSPLWIAVLTSWGIAFFEYCLAVPANRFGFGKFSLVQLKTIQEVVTLTVFAVFAILYMKEKLTINHLIAACCLVAAVFFCFKK